MADHPQVGKSSQHVTSRPRQLSLAIPLWLGAISTSNSWKVNRHTARRTSPIRCLVSLNMACEGLQLRRFYEPNECNNEKTRAFNPLVRFVLLYPIISCLPHEAWAWKKLKVRMSNKVSSDWRCYFRVNARSDVIKDLMFNAKAKNKNKNKAIVIRPRGASTIASPPVDPSIMLYVVFVSAAEASREKHHE